MFWSFRGPEHTLTCSENNMATSKEYIDFVHEQIARYGEVKERKMFGEYMVYLGGKPVLLVCDNTVFVKKLAETEPVMKEFSAESGFPYEGAKEHFILDIENRALLDKIIPLLEKITPVPARRKKTKTGK